MRNAWVLTIASVHVPWGFLLHLIAFAQSMSVRGQIVSCPMYICSVFKHVSPHAGGRLSSWYNSDWALPAKQHQPREASQVIRPRTTRGAADVVTEAEVDVVEKRDTNHGCVVTKNAVGVTQATTVCNSILPLTTGKILYNRSWVNFTSTIERKVSTEHPKRTLTQITGRTT